MILFILPLIALAANNLIGGIDYLFKLLFPPVPNTVPLSQPYTPPFLGGQCVGIRYKIQIQYRIGNAPPSAPNWYNYNNNFQSTNTQSQFLGAISGVSTYQSQRFDGANTFYDFGFEFVCGNGTSRFSLGESIARSAFEMIAYQVSRFDNQVDTCGDLPNPVPPLSVGGGGLAQSPPPVLDPPPSNPNGNWFSLIAGVAAVAATALTAATAAAAATAATAVTAATAAATAATAAIASSPSGSTTQQQSQSQKLSADALVGIAQVLAEIAKQIAELEKEVRKVKTDEAKKEKDDAKKVIRYDFGSANRDGFIKLYPESNPDSYEATFVDVQIFNIPSGSGKYFGEKSPHYYKYKSLGQVHFVSPTFGILESREIDFARLSLNVPDNCFGFFYHFGLNGVVSANLSCFYIKTEKQAV